MIRLRGFLGELPALNPHYLSDRNGQIAQNVNLRSGSLRSLRGLLSFRDTTTPTTPETIFAYQGDWLEWSEQVDVTTSPVPNDADERVYYTKDPDGATPGLWFTDKSIYNSGGPPFPGTEHQAGVPAIASAPTATPDGSGSLGGSRFYVVTAVNTYDEEGPPSPTSSEVTLSGHDHVDLSWSAPPAGDYAPVSKYFIYRTNSLGTAFQFVGETASTSFVDDVEILQEELEATEWTAPPTDIHGLIALPNGTLAAFRRNQVLFSEPGLPHAWPSAYRYPVDYDIVGLGVIDNGVIVMTVGQPALLLGAHPGSIRAANLEVPFACLSKLGIVQMGRTAVVYPSARGLVRVTSAGAQLVTAQVFDTEDWEALQPSTARAFNWRNLYASFYTSLEGNQEGYILNPASPTDGVVTVSGFSFKGVYEDPTDGDVFVASNDRIAEWDAGNLQQFRWRSKPFDQLSVAAYTTVQVFAEDYPVTVNVYREGRMQASVRVGSKQARRVPNSVIGRSYEVEVIGKTEVYEVVLSSSMQALRQV